MSLAVQKITRNTTSLPVSAPISEWLVILMDKPGVLERRLQIRPVHSKNFVKLHQSGFVSWAGPVFKEHVKEGIRPFVGSIMVVNAENPDMVKATLEKDIFVKERIWDWESVRILPFKTVFRQPAPRKAE